MKVTNKAQGPRHFQVKNDNDDGVHTHVLRPGESGDLNLAVRDHPVLKAWDESGEVEFEDTARRDRGAERAQREQLPKFGEMSDDDLRKYLQERRVKVDPNWKHDRLVGEAYQAAAAAAA